MIRLTSIIFITVSLLLSADECFSQKKTGRKISSPGISGTYQITKFVSNNQVQQKDYKGTGSLKKFPCINCPVTIIKKDSVHNIRLVFLYERRRTVKKDTSFTRLGAFTTYTKYSGVFNCTLKGFKMGDEIYVIYGSSYSYKRRLKLSYDTDAGVYTEN